MWKHNEHCPVCRKRDWPKIVGLCRDDCSKNSDGIWEEELKTSRNKLLGQYWAYLFAGIPSVGKQECCGQGKVTARTFVAVGR